MIDVHHAMFKAGQIAQGHTAEELRERLMEMHRQDTRMRLELPLTHIALAMVKGVQPNEYWLNRPWHALFRDAEEAEHLK